MPAVKRARPENELREFNEGETLYMRMKKENLGDTGGSKSAEERADISNASACIRRSLTSNAGRIMERIFYYVFFYYIVHGEDGYFREGFRVTEIHCANRGTRKAGATTERKEAKFIMSRERWEDRYPLRREAEINKNFTSAREK